VPDLDEESPVAKRSRAKSANENPLLNPDGIYSGMTKRVAIENGRFSEIEGMPGDMRNRGRMTHKNAASGRRETS
jgi:hypothetical protein